MAFYNSADIDSGTPTGFLADQTLDDMYDEERKRRRDRPKPITPEKMAVVNEELDKVEQQQPIQELPEGFTLEGQKDLPEGFILENRNLPEGFALEEPLKVSDPQSSDYWAKDPFKGDMRTKPIPEIRSAPPMTQEELEQELFDTSTMSKAAQIFAKRDERRQSSWDHSVTRMADQMFTHTTGLTPEQGIKGKKNLRNVMARMPALGLGMGYSPLIQLGFEVLGQAKNLAVSAIKDEAYSPLDIKILSELLPDKAPNAVKIAAMGSEYLIDIALMGAATNLAREKMLVSTIKEVGRKMTAAGLGEGKVNVNLDAIKKAARGTSLETAMKDWLNVKLGNITKAKTALPPGEIPTVSPMDKGYEVVNPATQIGVPGIQKPVGGKVPTVVEGISEITGTEQTGIQNIVPGIDPDKPKVDIIEDKKIAREKKGAVIRSLMDTDDIEVTFDNLGYVKDSNGIWVVPEAQGQWDRITDDVKQILAKNGIMYVEDVTNEGLAGGGTSIKNGDNLYKGIGVADSGEGHIGYNHTALHEAGHVQVDNLSPEDKKLFFSGEVVTEHANKIVNREPHYVKVYGNKGPDSPLRYDEDFAELWALYRGDLDAMRNAKITGVVDRNRLMDTERYDSVKSTLPEGYKVAGIEQGKGEIEKIDWKKDLDDYWSGDSKDELAIVTSEGVVEEGLMSKVQVKQIIGELQKEGKTGIQIQLKETDEMGAFDIDVPDSKPEIVAGISLSDLSPEDALIRSYSGLSKKKLQDLKKKAKEKMALVNKEAKDLLQMEIDVIDSLLDPWNSKTTQKDKVKDVLKGGEKSIKEIAEQTAIVEPNVRRILGVGAKEGEFVRVRPGVYTLSLPNGTFAYIQAGDALTEVPKLAAEGFKPDMVFLDIPYKTPAVTGGNRGVKYDLISPVQFDMFLTHIKKMAGDETPVVYMFSQAASGAKEMGKYTNSFIRRGFKPIARGEWQKLFKSGEPVTNVRGNVSMPEGIIIFNKSGNFSLPAVYDGKAVRITKSYVDETRGLVYALDYVEGGQTVVPAREVQFPQMKFRLTRPSGYSTKKPESMLRDIIKMTTDEGDVVFDPFAGSGVTLGAALSEGRSAVGIEKSEEAIPGIKNEIEAGAKNAPQSKPPFRVHVGEQVRQSLEDNEDLGGWADEEGWAYFESKQDATDFVNDVFSATKEMLTVQQTPEKPYYKGKGSENLKAPPIKLNGKKVDKVAADDFDMWKEKLDNADTMSDPASGAQLRSEMVMYYNSPVEKLGGTGKYTYETAVAIADSIDDMYIDYMEDKPVFKIGDTVKSYGTAQRFESGKILEIKPLTGKKAMTVQGTKNYKYLVELPDGTTIWRNQTGIMTTKEVVPGVAAEKAENNLPDLPKATKVFQGRGKAVEEIYKGIAKPVLGDANYYALNNEDASMFGDDVVEKDIVLKNSLEIRNDTEWRGLQDAAGANVGNQFQPGASKEDTKKMVSDAIDKMKRHILALGYDSVIIKMDQRGDYAKQMRRVFGIDQIVDYTGLEDQFSPPVEVDEAKQELNNLNEAINEEKHRIDFAERSVVEGKMTRDHADQWIAESKERIVSLEAIRDKGKKRIVSAERPLKIGDKAFFMIGNGRTIEGVVKQFYPNGDIYVESEGKEYVARPGDYLRQKGVIPAVDEPTVDVEAEQKAKLEEQDKANKQRAAANVLVEKGETRAVYKIKMDATIKVQTGHKVGTLRVEGAQRAGFPGTGETEKKGGPIYKNLTSADIQSALQQQLDDVQIDEEMIDGVPYVVISGIPKPMRGRIKGKLKSYFASPGGKKGVGNIDAAEIMMAIEMQANPFKLSEAVADLIKRHMDELYGEGYTPKGAAGVLYTDTGNVFIKALNDFYSATHEMAHALDLKAGALVPLATPIGFSSNGNPKYDPKTLALRKEFTKIYTDFYPGGKKDHKLAKKIDEGYAVFVSHAIAYPTETAENYPKMWKAIMSAEGMLYNPKIIDFIHDAKDVLGRYQALSPMDKILSRITEVKKQAGEKFLNPAEMLVMELSDDISFLEKVGVGAGLRNTELDPSISLRFYRMLPHILQHNVGNLGFTRRLAKDIISKMQDIKGGKILENFQTALGVQSFITIGPDGNPTELYDFNWKTLSDSIENIRHFDGFLVSRLTHFAYQRMDALEIEAIKATAMIELLQKQVEQGIMTKSAFNKEIEPYVEILNDLQWHQNYLNENGVNREVAQQAYTEAAPMYVKQAEMFDKLKRADWDMKHHPLVQLINDKTYERGLKNTGYATTFRQIENELIGESAFQRFATRASKKIKSTFMRKGGMQDITGPFQGSIQDHYDTFKKSWKQLTLNRLHNVIEAYPKLFQPLPLERTYNPKTKRFHYEQDTNPNILMLRKNYKRYPVLAHQDFITFLDEALNPQNVGMFSQVLLAFTNLFTKGTTALNWQFAAKNLGIDQFSAGYNTQTNYIPLISPINNIISYLSNTDSAPAQFAREYFIYARGSHTFVSLQYMEPKKVYNFLNTEKEGLNWFIDQLENTAGNVGDFLSTPVRLTELLTRMSEYIRARSQGRGAIVALEMAGRVSVPFHHRGRLGRSELKKTWLRSLPYAPAAIQVLTQAIRTGATPETRTRALMVMALMMVGASGAALYTMKKGTEEQKEKYKNIPIEEKVNYIWFPNPDGKGFYRVPVPNELILPATIFNMVMEDKILNALYTREEYIAAITSPLPDQLNITDPEGMVVSLIPQIGKVPMGLFFNKRMWPKVSDLQPDYMRLLPPEDRKFLTTSPAATYLSEKFRKKKGMLGIGFLGGYASNWLSGGEDVSPIQIDSILEGYGGSGARFFSGKKGFKNLLDAYHKDPRFGSSRDVRFYYDEKDKLEKLYNLANKDNVLVDKNKIRMKQSRFKGIEKQFEYYSNMMKRVLDRDEDPDKDKLILQKRKYILERIAEYRKEFY